MQTQVTVNVDRLFSKISRYFGSPESSFTEAFQNAHRACLPIAPGTFPEIRVAYTTTDGTIELTFEDPGRGIADPIKMLSLASSEWERDVEGDQDPAGMGVCGILAFCKAATWQSAFGSLTVDSEAFFHNPQYRDRIMQDIDPASTRAVGTKLTMHGFQVSPHSIAGIAIARTQWYTDVTVTINGRPAVRPDLPAFQGKVAGRDSLIYSDFSGAGSRSGSGSDNQSRIQCIWHGIIIPAVGFVPDSITLPSPAGDLTYVYSTSYAGLLAMIDVRDENSITPQLPDRTRLKLDTRTCAFLNEAWASLIAQYHKAVLQKLDASPRDLNELKSLRRPRVNVPMYEVAFASYNPWRCGKTCRLRDDRDDARHRSQGDIVHRDEYRTYALDETVVLTDLILAPVADLPHGLLFDDGAEDPLAEAGFYRGGKPTHQLIFDLGPEKHQLSNTGKALDIPRRLYAIPDGAMAVARPCTGDYREFLAQHPEFEVDISGSSVSFCDEDFDSPSELIRDLKVLGDGEAFRAIQQALCSAHNSWAQHHHDSDYDDFKEAEAEWQDYWDSARARWTGKIHISVDLNSIRYALPGGPRKFEVDLDARTVTTPDGVAHKVTW